MGNALQILTASEYANNVILFSRDDCDVADRLNHLYTTFILFWLATVVTCKQYVGEPIQCWTPQHFTKHHDAYTNDLCWTRNTYYLPFNESIPPDSQGKSQRDTIVYYQWIPIILLVQAFMFCLPRIFWMTFSDHSGIDTGSFVESGAIIATHQMESRVRDTVISRMTVQVDRYLGPTAISGKKTRYPPTLSFKHVLSRTCFRMIGHRYANYLVTVYLFTKGFYIANVIGQLLSLNAFLGTSFSTYGIDVIKALIQGEDWAASKRFPRVTMCDLNVRRLGNLHRYTVQCVLPINLFNEKIFLFLWFWFVLVAMVTCFSTVAWILRVTNHRERRLYIRRFLNVAGKIKIHGGKFRDKFDSEKFSRFTDDYLRQDGVFLVRLLSTATTGLTAMEVTAAMWDCYFSKVELLSDKDSDDPSNNNATRRPTLSNVNTDSSGLPDYHSVQELRDIG